MSTPEIEPWMELAAMEQAREIWPGSAQDADRGIQEGVNDLRELSQKLAAIIAGHSPASLERELAEALRDAMKFIAIEDAPTMHAHTCAVLRKYDKAQATPPPTPARD